MRARRWLRRGAREPSRTSSRRHHARDLGGGWESLDRRELLSITGLDPSFGTDGLATNDLSKADYGVSISGGRIASVRQSDGKVVVVGPGEVEFTSGIIAARFNQDGTLDKTFGTGGVAGVTDVPVPIGTSVAIAPGGDIVVGGFVPDNIIGGNSSAFFVARFTANGLVDATFNGGLGFAVAQLPGRGSAIQGIAVQPDGKIVAVGAEASSVEVQYGQISSDCGFEVVRYNANGSLDASFGVGGIVTTPFVGSKGADPTAVAIQPNGSIVAVGSGFFGGYGGIVAARYTASGSLDPSFNGNGTEFVPTYTTDPTYNTPALRGQEGSVVIQADGKVVATGGQGTVIVANSILPAPIPSITRFNPNGTIDRTFGSRGLVTFGSYGSGGGDPDALALQPNGEILAAITYQDQPGGSVVGLARLNPNGTVDTAFGVGGLITSKFAAPSTSVGVYALPSGQVLLSVLLDATNVEFGLARYGTAAADALYEPPGDMDGLSKTDIAVYLPAYGEFAIRPSNGAPDEIIPFGIPGVGDSIPVVGDYDGSGRDELAVYFPASGEFVYRPAKGGPDKIIPFGIPGVGNSIPVPADYDGSGHLELGVYLTSLGAFAYRPANGGPDVIVPFGFAGRGQSIPVPGDYDGSGHTELAVYLPSIGSFAYRPFNDQPDRVIPFGSSGAGASIPAPGDYDGSGHTELAVYLPSVGEFAYRPANGGPDKIIPFGTPGPGNAIPAPGDYDGSGRTELAVYLPLIGEFAYRPAKGGADRIIPFGIPGPGNDIPVTALPS